MNNKLLAISASAKFLDPVTQFLISSVQYFNDTVSLDFLNISFNSLPGLLLHPIALPKDDAIKSPGKACEE